MNDLSRERPIPNKYILCIALRIGSSVFIFSQIFNNQLETQKRY